jgi:hypothetical protein
LIGLFEVFSDGVGDDAETVADFAIACATRNVFENRSLARR